LKIRIEIDVPEEFLEWVMKSEGLESLEEATTWVRKFFEGYFGIAWQPMMEAVIAVRSGLMDFGEAWSRARMLISRRMEEQG